MSCGESFEKEDLKVNKLWLLSFDLLFLKTLNKHRCQLYMTKTEIAIPTQIHSAECLNAQKKYQFNP
jgi:hypothetical protein